MNLGVGVKKAARITIISLVVVFVVAGVVAWAATWTGSTKDIRAVADQFRPPASWQLVDEMIEPPRMLCLQDVACPSLHKSWKTSHIVTKGEFIEALSNIPVNKVGGTCPEKAVESVTSQGGCYISTVMDGYSLQIGYNIGPEMDGNSVIYMNIKDSGR